MAAGRPFAPVVGPTTWAVTRVAETGSTNTDLLAAAAAGAPAGTVLVTDHQTRGRGRLSRTWVDPPGSSLLVSVLLRPALPVDRLHRCTQAMAVAAARACGELAGVQPELKWPNDLMVGPRKLAGILAESRLTPSGGVEAVVVGMGLNLNWPPAEELPGELRERMIALNHVAGPVDGAVLLAAVLDHLGTLDDATLDAEYPARLATLGQLVRVERAGDVLFGTAVAVDPDGRLVVDAAADAAAGERHRIDAGDVVHLRRVKPGQD